MDFNSSCGSQISTASMSNCQYTPQISEGELQIQIHILPSYIKALKMLYLSKELYRYIGLYLYFSKSNLTNSIYFSLDAASTQATNMHAQQQSVISTQSPVGMQPSQMQNHHVSDEEAYGESNGYPTLSNLFAVANQQNNNNNIIEGTTKYLLILIIASIFSSRNLQCQSHFYRSIYQ